jgi:hypothetical protein
VPALPQNVLAVQRQGLQLERGQPIRYAPAAAPGEKGTPPMPRPQKSELGLRLGIYVCGVVFLF